MSMVIWTKFCMNQSSTSEEEQEEKKKERESEAPFLLPRTGTNYVLFLSPTSPKHWKSTTLFFA